MNGQFIEVDDDAIKDKKIMEMARPPMPVDILRSTDDQRMNLNDLANVTPAMQGYAEQADESGKLYQSKVRQSMIGLESLSNNIKYKLEELGRMYLKSAKEVYAGPSRKFVDFSTNMEFFVNRYIVNDAGEAVPMNFISDLPEYMITIDEKRIGKAKRDEEIQTYTELLQHIQNPVLRAMIEADITKNLDRGEDMAKELDQAAQVWIKAKVAEVQAIEAQAKQMVDQSSAPPAPPQGAPQGAPQGMPVG